MIKKKILDNLICTRFYHSFINKIFVYKENDNTKNEAIVQIIKSF